jgi:hypothetical protein
MLKEYIEQMYLPCAESSTVASDSLIIDDQTKAQVNA